MSLNMNIISAIFSDSFREDANVVSSMMKTEEVNRLRTEKSVKEHPLLAVRLSSMTDWREQIRSVAGNLLEGIQPLNTVGQVQKLSTDVRLSLESCLRVLECSKAPEVLKKVSDSARALGGSLNLMAKTLSTRGHALAEPVEEEALKAADISENVASIAGELNSVYSQMRITIEKQDDNRPPSNDETSSSRG